MVIESLSSQNLPIGLVFNIALIIITATIVAYIARALKQPLIAAYVLTGIILGPIGFGLIKDVEVIRALSELGIAFLLFIVGLEMNLNKLKEVGLISSIIAIFQVLATFFFGIFVATQLGFNFTNSVYIGLVLAFSSTLIIVKILSDKEKLDTLHGRIILSILLVQDIIAIFALALLPNLGSFSTPVIFNSIWKGILLFLISFLIGKFLLPSIFNFAAKSKELLFLCSVSVCFLFAFIAYNLEFSIVIGAFIAGISLGVLPYRWDVIGRIRPLKDFFSTFFFVFLGMALVIPNDFNIYIKPLVYLLLVVLLFKPFIIMLLCSIFGYEKRTSFLSAILLAQISEFSLLLVTQGLVYGHISQEIFSMTVLLAVISITLTAYITKHEDTIYSSFSRFLNFFERIALWTVKLEYKSKSKDHNVVLFGCHRMGTIFLETFRSLNMKVLVVDDNPETIKGLMKEKINCIYGDANNLEILERINLSNVKIVVSTLPETEVNRLLLKHIKDVNKNAVLFLTANHLEEAIYLYNHGADYVILPHLLGGEAISHLLKRVGMGKKELKALREKHIKYLTNVQYFHNHAHPYHCKFCKPK